MLDGSESITNKKLLTKEEKLNLLTNKLNIPFTALIDVIHDDSNHNSITDLSPSGFSDTVRQTIFRYRYPEDQYERDVTDNVMLAISQGNARHLWAEKGWNSPDTVKTAMRLDKLNPDLYNALMINPERGTVIPKGKIPIYVEQPLKMQYMNGLLLGGTPDLIFNGQVQDYKTTSPYVTMYEDSVKKYVLQLSGYRFLEPERITKDDGLLLFRYPKWDERDSFRIKGYPKQPIESIAYKLYSQDVMKEFLEKKTKEIASNLSTPDHLLPPCPENLLGIKSEYKTYSSIDNYHAGKNAGRVFRNGIDEAYARVREMKTGALVEFRSEPSLCRFCAFSKRCNQFVAINKAEEIILKVW